MTDRRQAAQEKTKELIALLQAQPRSGAVDSLLHECDALTLAIAAFHMEAIRFRMFNVDRLLNRSGVSIPTAAAPLFADIRQELEAAGFHTRSHQAPS
jgi:hypothetical protein